MNTHVIEELTNDEDDKISFVNSFEFQEKLNEVNNIFEKEKILVPPLLILHKIQDSKIPDKDELESLSEKRKMSILEEIKFNKEDEDFFNFGKDTEKKYIQESKFYINL